MSQCSHNHRIGDNYGVTCQDCGEVLAGYGYWGEGVIELIIQDPPFAEEGDWELAVRFSEIVDGEPIGFQYVWGTTVEPKEERTPCEAF